MGIRGKKKKIEEHSKKTFSMHYNVFSFFFLGAILLDLCCSEWQHGCTVVHV